MSEEQLINVKCDRTVLRQKVAALEAQLAEAKALVREAREMLETQCWVWISWTYWLQRARKLLEGGGG